MSTLLREACRNLGSGVGYLDVNPVRRRGRALTGVGRLTVLPCKR